MEEKATTKRAESPRWMVWAGRVCTAIPVLMLTASAAMKLSGNAEFATQFQDHLGYPAGTLMPIGVVELLCTAIYAVPRTSMLGAALLTAYLGGATATHVRVGEPFVAPVLIGALIWVGLYLREPRLREIAPLR